MEQGVQKAGVPSPWRAACALGQTEPCSRNEYLSAFRQIGTAPAGMTEKG